MMANDSTFSYLSLFEGHLQHELNYSPHTREAYLRDLNQFITWLCGDNPSNFKADDVATADVRSWLASLAHEGISPRSIRRKAQSLRAFFKFLRKEGKIHHNPTAEISLPKLPKPLPDIIRAAEIEKILYEDQALKSSSPSLYETPEKDASANDEERALEILENLVVEILYSLGLRRAELAAIDDNDISSYPPEIKITGKRNKQRIVPLPSKLLRKIKEWQNIRNQVWPISNGSNPLLVKKGKRLSTGQIYLIVRKHLKDIDARKKGPHALRHTFATSMLNEGADLNSVKEFLGHASLATTQIYTHISFAEIKKAYQNAHPRSGNKK